jgi:hypothetical protein
MDAEFKITSPTPGQIINPASLVVTGLAKGSTTTTPTHTIETEFSDIQVLFNGALYPVAPVETTFTGWSLTAAVSISGSPLNITARATKTVTKSDKSTGDPVGDPAVTIVSVSVDVLFNGMAAWDRRFREAHDWAGWHGFATAWPNFHQADYGDGVVYGTFLLPGSTVDWRDVPRGAYGVFAIEDVPAMFRGANDYAVSQGYAAGLPNFHQADYGQGVVYGTFLVKPGTVDFRDVPAIELGVFDRRDAPAMLRAAGDYATAHGYAAGFPTFHEADYGSGLGAVPN